MLEVHVLETVWRFKSSWPHQKIKQQLGRGENPGPSFFYTVLVSITILLAKLAPGFDRRGVRLFRAVCTARMRGYREAVPKNKRPTGGRAFSFRSADLSYPNVATGYFFWFRRYSDSELLPV